MAQSRIVNLLSVQRRPTQSSIEILSITRLTNHVSILGDELRDTGVSGSSLFGVPLAGNLDVMWESAFRRQNYEGTTGSVCPGSSSDLALFFGLGFTVEVE